MNRLASSLTRKHVRTAAILLLILAPSLNAVPYSFSDDGKDKTLKDKLTENAKKAGENGPDFNAILADLSSKAKDLGSAAGKSLDEVLGGNSEQMARNALQDFFEKGYPGQIGYGFMMGYSSGYAVKKVAFNHV